jgi:chromosome segregation ATPase
MSLELKKKQLELKRVETARFDLELKIEERLDEIKRLEVAIKQQIETEEKLKTQLNELVNKGK